MKRILFDHSSGQFLPWPRADGEDVVGLAPTLTPYEEISIPAPQYNPLTEALRRVETPDHELKTLTISWAIEAHPHAVTRAAVEAGYPVEPEGFTLAVGEMDQAAFTKMLVLLQTAESTGVPVEDHSQTIADKDGILHNLSTSRFRQIMTGYGMHCKQIWNAVASA